jgi:hypothetical protein
MKIKANKPKWPARSTTASYNGSMCFLNTWGYGSSIKGGALSDGIDLYLFLFAQCTFRSAGFIAYDFHQPILTPHQANGFPQSEGFK